MQIGGYFNSKTYKDRYRPCCKNADRQAAKAERVSLDRMQMHQEQRQQKLRAYQRKMEVHKKTPVR